MIESVDNEYQKRIGELTSVERVDRASAMFRWTREMLARRVVAELGPVSPERLKWEVALRQYGDEPAVRSMIEKILQNVSR